MSSARIAIPFAASRVPVPKVAGVSSARSSAPLRRSWVWSGGAALLLCWRRPNAERCFARPERYRLDAMGSGEKED